METIKIQVKRTVNEEQEIDVKFPLYTERQGMIYKAVNPTEVTRVINGHFQEITKSSIEYALGDGFKEISKEKFEQELAIVKTLLNI